MPSIVWRNILVVNLMIDLRFLLVCNFLITFYPGLSSQFKYGFYYMLQYHALLIILISIRVINSYFILIWFFFSNSYVIYLVVYYIIILYYYTQTIILYYIILLYPNDLIPHRYDPWNMNKWERERERIRFWSFKYSQMCKEKVN